jgi:hypothetical protein
MGWRKKLPVEEQERLERVGKELLPLFLDGVTVRDLEERYHLQAGMTYTLLREAGYRPGMRRQPQKRRKNPSPKRDRAEVRREAMAALYRDGATLEEIGEASGVTRERVRQLIGATGQKGRPSRVDPIRVLRAARTAKDFAQCVASLRMDPNKVERCLVETGHWPALNRLWALRKRSRKSARGERYLSQLRELAKRLGYTPGIVDINAEPGFPRHMTFVKYFGSISKAQALAGLEPGRVGVPTNRG